MEFNTSDSYERTPPTQRRVLRQSTLPNPDSISYPTNNLKIPSPKQQASPQYSPYHTDNENENEPDIPPPTIRYQIRRQSTLPCKPNEHHTTSMYLSTSPNRAYSRSPDPSAVEGEHNSRIYPPFVRQSTFPSNNGDQFHPRQLPTSPNNQNRLSYSKSPDSGGENGHVSPRRFMRQTTLPNPDQHIKLLPTSPPKKSPQFKRSPEFQRQNTISNPEGMSTLSVHQHGPKFLPISPRQKQSFLFPQPSTAPRTFLSQQHFPTMNEDQPPPTTTHHIREHSKMIKVRSHSNEEYSFNKSHVPPQPTDTIGRRLLPEIPNRARSPNRLVRQENVMQDEGEKRSPILKTFAEAKQTLNEEYEPQLYTNEYTELNSTFAEADENNYNEQMINQAGYNVYEMDPQQMQYVAETVQYLDATETRRYDMAQGQHQQQRFGVDNVLHDPTSDYYSPDEYIKQAQKNRNRRRKSRELPADPEVTVTPADDESRKHKPETMRSVSEDSSPRTIKILPRRSFSQPEKETQKKTEPTKLPSPNSFNEKVKHPSDFKAGDVDLVDKAPGPRKPVYKFPKMLEMRGDSKSFDAVVRQLIKPEGDDKSQSMDDNLFNDKKEVRKCY
jgi:synaptotagmin-like protein